MQDALLPTLATLFPNTEHRGVALAHARSFPPRLDRHLDGSASQLVPDERDRLFASLLNETREYEKAVASLTSNHEPWQAYGLRIFGFTPNFDRVHLSVDPRAYASTRFTTTPASVSSNVLRDVQFGYEDKGDFALLGRLHHAIVQDDRIVELAGPELMLDVFQQHLDGRQLTQEKLERVWSANEFVFHRLRNHPEGQQHLNAFAVGRGWRAGLEDEAHLAYFHPKIHPLLEWATAEGVSIDDLYLAGWVTRQYTRDGRESVSLTDADVIRIPFFNAEGRIVSWRTRNLDPKRAARAKYLSNPLRREVRNPRTPHEGLYNAWKLDAHQGEHLILTEGEFKCLVTTDHGVLTLGMPGITECSDAMLDLIASANPSGVTVVLDRDPSGKGRLRVDDTTDSQRAAIDIAQRLRARVENVRIGVLPDVFDGGKVGLDDYLLETRADLHEWLATSRSIEAYVDELGFDTTLEAFRVPRTAFRKAFKAYSNSVLRGAPTLSEAVLEDAQRQAISAFVGFKQWLATHYQGARYINQPRSDDLALFPANDVFHGSFKQAVDHHGRSIPLRAFTQTAVIIKLAPGDTREDALFHREGMDTVPHAHGLITSAYLSAENAAYRLARHGADLLGFDDPRENGAVFSACYAAALLTTQFPVEEYTFHPLVSLERFEPTCGTITRHTRIPLVIRKADSGTVVALTYTCFPLDAKEDVEDGTGEGHDPFRPRDFNSYVTLLSRARTHANEQARAAMYFLRIPNGENARFETMALAEALQEFHDAVGTSARAVAHHPSVKTLRPHEAYLVPGSAWHDLANHLSHKRSVLRASRAGLLAHPDDLYARPRLNVDTLVVPLHDLEGRVEGFRLAPLESVGEHALAPTRSPVNPTPYMREASSPHTLGGRASGMRDIPDDGSLEGQVVLLAQNDLDALLLRTRHPHVVGLPPSGVLRRDDGERLRRSRATIVLVKSMEAVTPFDHLGLPRLQTHAVHAHHISQTIERTSRVRVALTSTPLATIDSEDVPRLVEDACDAPDLHAFTRAVGIDRAYFTTVLAPLCESLRAIATFLWRAEAPETVGDRPISHWLRTLDKAYSAYERHTRNAFDLTPRTPTELLGGLVGVREAKPVRELVRAKFDGCAPASAPLFDPEASPAITDHLVSQHAGAYMNENDQEPHAYDGLVPLPETASGHAPTGVIEVGGDRVAMLERLLDSVGTARPVYDVQELGTTCGGAIRITFADGSQYTSATLVGQDEEEVRSKLAGKALEHLSLATPHRTSSRSEGGKPATARLSEYCQANRLSMPTYEVQPLYAGRFTATVTVHVDDVLFEASGQGQGKRGAKTAAAEALLPSLPEEVPTQPTTREVDLPVKTPLSELNEILQRENLPAPAYEYEPSEEGFVCTATWAPTQEATHTVTSTAGSKRAARQAAAQGLLDQYAQAANTEAA